MEFITDATLLRVVDDVDRSLTRRKYEETLVKQGLYSLDRLRDSLEYDVSKRDLIITTLRESHGVAILKALHDARALSGDTLRALAMDGLELGRSIAAEFAKPAEEHSRLETGLSLQGMQQVQDFLNQSLENYVQCNYEAANAMTRTALEHMVELIAQRISSMRGGENIKPPNKRYIGPIDYRNYLHKTGFLDASEKEFLDKFYGYASTDGSHPGVSSEAEARLRRFVAVGIALLFLEKLENSSFMSNL